MYGNIVKMNENIIETEDVIMSNNIPGMGCLYYNNIKQFATENRIAQIIEKTGEEDSFGSLFKRCIRTAMFMQKNGINKGDVIAVIGPKHVNSVVPFIASQFIGAIPTCVAYNYPENDIKCILKSIEPKIIFTDSRCLSFIKGYLSDIGLKVSFVVFDDCKEGFCFCDIIKPQVSEDNFEPVKIENLQETAVLYYSSGATGSPKPICLSHYGLLTSIARLPPPKELDTEVLEHFQKQCANGVRYVDYQPLYWISSEISRWISEGHTRILVETFQPMKFWEIVDKYKANFTFLAPNFLMELSKCRKPDHLNVDSLCSILVGGYRTLVEWLIDVRKMVHPLTIVMSVYGLTEFIVGTLYYDIREKSTRKFLNEKLESVGMVGRGLSIKVVDVDTDEIVGPNQHGEIRIKSKRAFTGYYKMDSIDCWDEDGYFKTGDIGYYDEDKCFYIVDRIKGIFKYNRFPKIHACDIEAVVMKHPAVKRAVVFGYPHPIDQNHATAVVILNENANATPEEIREFVDSRVDDHLRLRGGVKIVKALPLTPNGKIKSGDLKALVDAN